MNWTISYLVKGALLEAVQYSRLDTLQLPSVGKWADSDSFMDSFCAMDGERLSIVHNIYIAL